MDHTAGYQESQIPPILWHRHYQQQGCLPFLQNVALHKTVIGWVGPVVLKWVRGSRQSPREYAKQRCSLESYLYRSLPTSSFESCALEEKKHRGLIESESPAVAMLESRYFKGGLSLDAFPKAHVQDPKKQRSHVKPFSSSGFQVEVLMLSIKKPIHAQLVWVCLKLFTEQHKTPRDGPFPVSSGREHLGLKLTSSYSQPLPPCIAYLESKSD